MKWFFLFFISFSLFLVTSPRVLAQSDVSDQQVATDSGQILPTTITSKLPPVIAHILENVFGTLISAADHLKAFVRSIPIMRDIIGFFTHTQEKLDEGSGTWMK